MKKLLDILIPTSPRDWIVVVAVIVAIIVAYRFVGVASLGAGLLLFGQRSNKEQKRAANATRRAQEIVSNEIAKAEAAGKSYEETKQVLAVVAKRVYDSDGKTNEEIVNTIRKSGF